MYQFTVWPFASARTGSQVFAVADGSTVAAGDDVLTAPVVAVDGAGGAALEHADRTTMRPARTVP